ncbi:DUF7426 family protein [Micromonospora tarensis]|uniref:DUF7426 domain-containing protein n=1 Tax=Micromonospora tarensis TaxID=2806100 RepID=A0ABS1YD24_9ACTN|nr:hypothetical protein [Micromonospora tarensis]MBM0275321.1 hypothetical protein [Micromonospora tarensis]
MALQLGQIDQVFDPALVLPIGGKEYRVEDVPALLGLYCQRVWASGVAVAQAVRVGEDGDTAAAQRAVDGINRIPLPPGVDEGTPLHVAVLGDTYQRMLDDGVSGRWIQHAGMTTIAWLAAGDEVAEMYWASAGRPEAPAPNREQRRRGGASSSTGAANKTRSPASTSGTSSRRRGNRGRGSRSGGTTS